MDWSEKVLCIKCNEGGNLLVCSEDGCPLAVHEGCMGCPVRFDDAGRYYCPYCFYKQAVAESRKAREYALAKKKALLLFMDEKMIGNEKHIEEDKRAQNNGHNESKYGEANEEKLTCNNGKSKANGDASLDQSMQHDKEQKIDNEEAEKVQKEESEGSSGSKGQDPSPKLHEEQSFSNEVDKKSQKGNQGISNEEETKKQEEERSIDNGEEEHDNMHKHYISDNEEEKIQEEISEPSPSSGEDLLHATRARRTRRPKRKKPEEQDSEAVSARKYPTMKKKTSQTINPPVKYSRRSQGPNQVVGSPPQRLKTPEKAIVKLPSNAFGCGKRKRLLWTEKEEEALKEGVEIFSKEANKNTPWRKILHMGRGVFDSSRTPSDLKDKWRKIDVCRDGSSKLEGALAPLEILYKGEFQ